MPDSEDTLPRRVRRQVGTLGHAFSRLSAGIAVLSTRVHKGNILDEATRAWLLPWLPEDGAKLDLPIDNTHQALLAWREDGAWRVLNPCHEEGQTALPESWLRALVLLHLPVLRDYWTRALRRRRFARLRAVLPQAWPLDAQPLPPGAAISGLGIGRWDQLTSLSKLGKKFHALSLDEQRTDIFLDASKKELTEDLMNTLSTRRWILLEAAVADDEEQKLQMRWQHNDQGRVIEHQLQS